jgi:hypothetical protein
MLDDTESEIFLKVLSTLNEAQKRWFVGMKAYSLGHGGIQYLHKLTGISRPTITRGLKEIKSEQALSGERIRSEGGGRKTISDLHPEITRDLLKIMEEATSGDPMSPLLWTCKSALKISDELKPLGHQVSERTVNRLLHQAGYSLQLNSKQYEGEQHSDRDKQFTIINRKVTEFIEAQAAVISVDTKKKELIGNFKNSGTAWGKKGDPKKVNVYDFPSLADGKAIPYGAYDVQHNEGFVNVGITHDTAEFAVNSIECWWHKMGRYNYPNLKKLLICADGGGSNGSRTRAWKYYLQKLSEHINIPITVCHYPPGTSKWNKIEHRMWSFISMQWQGKPLISYETVVNLISSTTTKKGLRIKANLDNREYNTGKKISNSEMKKLKITYDSTLPNWNYTVSPG